MADTKVSAIIFWKTAAISENVSYKEVQKQNTSASFKTAGQEIKNFLKKSATGESTSYKEVQKQNTSANPKTANQEGKKIPEKNGHRENWTV